MPELPELIQALLDPKTYPESPSKIELVQTQMSFLFLGDRYVYKVKKPVNLGYLDYTTLDQRRYFCQREVELNRRLCRDIYLDVVPVTRSQGRFVLGGKGEALEYAVKMHRLPSEAMMDALLTRDSVSLSMVAGVAEKMAEFHKKAETSASISRFGELSAITVNTDENFSQTEKYIGVIVSAEQFRRIKDYTGSFIKDNALLFGRRVAGGRVRDCHGDLHAAHICFANGICIYDCIEFNDRFRYCDVASEIAFLAMDLDHYGRADLSHHFVDAYIAASQDEELRKLLSFYKCYRAYVRGKVACFKFDDPYITEPERKQTREIAGSYFDLAHAYTWSKPTLFITVGLVGTGKTTLAQALAKRLGLVVVSSDVIRKKLANVPLKERHFDEFDTGLYSAEFSRKTYNRMFTEARRLLSQGGSAILDASFVKSSERLKAKQLAEEMGADFYIVECVLDETSIRQRLDERVRIGAVSDGRWEIYEPQKRAFEPVTEVPDANHIMVDTSLPNEEMVRKLVEGVGW